MTNHLLVLGVLVPMAGLQFLCGMGAAFPQDGALNGAPAPGSAQAMFVAHAYLSAVPLFLCLWFLLCISHLRLAWALLERDWQRVFHLGSLIAAGTVSLLLFTGVLLIDDFRTVLQAGMLTIEFLAIAGLARWHARLSPGSTLEAPAG